jgi:hypothetical protein
VSFRIEMSVSKGGGIFGAEEELGEVGMGILP